MDTSSHSRPYTSPYTAATLAYQDLKALLLLGQVPVGVRLREERIADRLGMSRTPVREALLRLHAERFLERHPGGGYRAANPSTQAMRELYEIRRALELLALRRARANGGAARRVVEELREEWVSLGSGTGDLDAEFVHLDEDFHRRLAESSGNRELAEELRSINERIRPVRSHDFVTPGRIAATIEQHLQILDAVLARRVGRACALLDEHISESQAVVELAVARVLEQMLSAGDRDEW